MSDDVTFTGQVAPSPRLNEILSPDENVAKQKEEIRNSRERLKHSRQEILNNTDMAVGAPLHPTEFIRRLRKAGPHLRIEQGGIHNAVAIRVPVADDDSLSPTFGQQILKYVSGFYTDRILPEYSSFVNDDTGVPRREVRGWRTVLLMLIAIDALSYTAATKEFGEPQGQRNILWREQTQERRV